MTKCSKIQVLIFQNNINNLIIYLPVSIYMKNLITGSIYMWVN